MDLKQTPSIVTGGASGLGAATARLLASQGAKVALFDTNAELGQALAEELGGIFVRTDVTNYAEVQEAIAIAKQKHGTARVLVNCAGTGAPGKTVSKGKPYSIDQFRRIIEINLIGTFSVLSNVAVGMSEEEVLGEERGVIINTASAAAFEGQIGQVSYAASKAGIVGMTLPIARDLAQNGIRVVTIAPGLFKTPLLGMLPDDVQESLGRQTPFPNRLGDPSEFALLVRAIVENPMINGETIRLDGAIRMAPK